MKPEECFLYRGSLWDRSSVVLQRPGSPLAVRRVLACRQPESSDSRFNRCEALRPVHELDLAALRMAD